MLIVKQRKHIVWILHSAPIADWISLKYTKTKTDCRLVLKTIQMAASQALLTWQNGIFWSFCGTILTRASLIICCCSESKISSFLFSSCCSESSSFKVPIFFSRFRFSCLSWVWFSLWVFSSELVVKHFSHSSTFKDFSSFRDARSRWNYSFIW